MTRPVGITAARRAAEQASLCASLGLRSIIGSCIDVDRPVDDGRLAAPIRRAVDGGVHVAVFMTGVGAAHVLAAAERLGIAGEVAAMLDTAVVVARGTKARTALRRRGIRVDHVADPPQTAGVVDLLDRLARPGMRVLNQTAGPDDGRVGGAIAQLGAESIPIRPYDIDAPADDLPAVTLIRRAAAGGLSAVTFTSAHAVDGFAAIAERAEVDLEDITRSGVLIASVGRVTTAALRDHGLRVDVEPDMPRMGALYRALAGRLSPSG